MQLLDFTDYKAFLLQWSNLSKKERKGNLSKLAAHIQIHSSHLSQITRGTRHLTPEQALGAAEYLNLSELETQYFVDLVHLGRAGTKKLVSYYEKRLENIRETAKKISSKVKGDVLSDRAKIDFYSTWKMSGVRLATSIPNAELRSIAKRLKISMKDVEGILEFLLKEKLIVKKDEHYEMGPSSTFIPKDSPLVIQHWRNWRLRGMDVMEKRLDRDLFYSAPFSADEVFFQQFRQKLLEWISELNQDVGSARSEDLFCVNLDFFKL